MVRFGENGSQTGRKTPGHGFWAKGPGPALHRPAGEGCPPAAGRTAPGVLGNNDLPPGTHADGGHIFALLWGFRFGWFKGPELTAHGNPPFWKNMIFLTFAVLIVPPPTL